MDLLHRNLNTLVFLNPSLASPTLLKCFYKNLFEVPDKYAFQQIIHFFLNIISPKKCKNGYIWPLLDRGSERQFLIEVRTIIIELKEEFPQHGISSFPASFLTNPCGPRFTCLMVKLSVIALELSTRCDPSARNFDVQSLTATAPYLDLNLKVLKSDTMFRKTKWRKTEVSVSRLRLEAKKLARNTSEKWQAECKKITELETDLANHLSKPLVLPEEMKRSLLDVKNQKVISDWCSDIATRRENVKQMVAKLKACDRRMDAAYKIVESANAMRKAAHCLDGSRLCINISQENLETLVPSVKDQQIELFTKDGLVVLPSIVLINNECLKILLDTMSKKEVLTFARSFPHAAIREHSLKLKLLSETGKNICQSLFELTATSRQFIENFFGTKTVSDSGKEWMAPYQLEKLKSPPLFVFENLDVLSEDRCNARKVSDCELIPVPNHEQRVKAILDCTPDITPSRSFLCSSPVVNWIVPHQPRSDTISSTATTKLKECVARVSRLPVLCSSSHKYASSVNAKSRILHGSSKVSKTLYEEFNGQKIGIVPTPNTKTGMGLAILLSPLATELPESPAFFEEQPLATDNFICVLEKEQNTPDILKHTLSCLQPRESSAPPMVSEVFVDEISCTYNDVLNDSKDADILDVSAILNYSLYSPTESVYTLSARWDNSAMPSTSHSLSISMPDEYISTPVGTKNTKSPHKDCSIVSSKTNGSTPSESEVARASFTLNSSTKENGSTPAGSKKGKTPSTLERIISRYKNFKARSKK